MSNTQKQIEIASLLASQLAETLARISEVSDLSDAQRLVSERDQKIRELENKVETLEASMLESESRRIALEMNAKWYDLLQVACAENETVLSAWENLCSAMLLASGEDTPAINAVVRM